MVSCNLNSSTVTTILPGTSKEVGETSTRLPTQQSIPPNGTLSLSTPTQQPQPTYNTRNIVLTVSRSDSIINALLFFDREMNLQISSTNEYNPSLSSIGCHLLSVYDNQNGFEIVTKDFLGKVIKKELALENRNVEDRIYNFLFSPSEEWLTYLVITGDWGMSYADAETQDVRLLKIDGESPQNARLLTSRGGARPDAVVWSPDGQYLAFTDFDEKGFQQVFLFSLETGLISQISHFGGEMKNEQIVTIKWSFDSNYLAFAIYRDLSAPDQDTGAIYVYDLKNGHFQMLNIRISFIYAQDIWWGEGHRLLINQRLQNELSTSTDFAIVWFDVKKNVIIRKLTQDEIGAESFLVVPLADDLDRILITGLPFPEIYIYDFTNNELIIKEQELIDGIYNFVKTSGGLLRSPGCENGLKE
jgi:WD40 repeat protein